MRKNCFQKNKNFQKSGFTLVEVLVVVGIIGLLASVVLVGLGTFRTRSRDARRIADLREVQNALELYYTGNNSYPKVTGWENLEKALTGATIGISNIANDPLGGNNTYYYCYSTVDASPQGYILGAKFEDSSNPALSDSVKSASGFDCNALIDCANAKDYCVRF